MKAISLHLWYCGEPLQAASFIKAVRNFTVADNCIDPGRYYQSGFLPHLSIVQIAYFEESLFLRI